VAIVFVIFGFVIGVGVGSGAALFALAGGRDMSYWSLVSRYPVIAQLARLSIIASIIACGFVFAYFGYMLAE
jgi:hypothetical protein